MRISFQIGTIITPTLPFIAFHCIKITAMTCKCPAVMKCPNYRDFLSFNEVEDQFYVNIVSMDIMKMYKIRFDFNNDIQKPFCGIIRSKTMSVGESGFQDMKKNFIHPANLYQI